MVQFLLSLCVDLFLSDSLCTSTWNLKVYQLHEFAICTSSQGGNERSQLKSKLLQSTSVYFPDLNPNFYDNLNNMKLDLNIPAKAKFSANEQSRKFKNQGKQGLF